MLNGLMRLNIEQSYDMNFPIVHCVDDTLIIMCVDNQQLLILKDILEKFNESTNLRANYNKNLHGAH